MAKFQKGNKYGKGRPKKEHCLTDKIREIGQIQDPETKATKYDELARIVWSEALSGDKAAIAMIFDRIEGKPHQSLGISGEKETMQVILDSEAVAEHDKANQQAD